MTDEGGDYSSGSIDSDRYVDVDGDLENVS
jgi:hypothetical protein